MVRLLLYVLLFCGTGMLAVQHAPLRAQDSKARPANAQKKSTPNRSEKRSPTTKKPMTRPRLSVDEESAAVAFADEHHPELGHILARLRKAGPSEYQLAVRDVHQAVVRIERWKTRSPEKYRSELQSWKLDSRIQLLAARLAMGDDPQGQQQLQSMIRKRLTLRLAQLKQERKRLLSRLDKIEEGVDRIESNREAEVDRELQRLLASGRNRRPPRNAKAPKKQVTEKNRKQQKDEQ